MNDSNPPKRRWYCLTPDRLLIALLPVLGLLYLSERFQWFAFNEDKGWTVLIAVAVVCAAILLLALWHGVSLVFRRRFQFSIRTLLLVVLLVSIPLSWLGVKIDQARKQRAAEQAIEEVGGQVKYDYELRGSKPPPVWLAKLFGNDIFSHIAEVYLTRGAGHAELKHVAGLTTLEVLSVHGRLTDTDLQNVKELTQLRNLIWTNTRVTDAGLEHLKGLTQLQELDLTCCDQLTDVGLEHLEGLTNLRWLRVESTQVTDEGVKALQHVLPDCDIWH